MEGAFKVEEMTFIKSGKYTVYVVGKVCCIQVIIQLLQCSCMFLLKALERNLLQYSFRLRSNSVLFVCSTAVPMSLLTVCWGQLCS